MSHTSAVAQAKEIQHKQDHLSFHAVSHVWKAGIHSGDPLKMLRLMYMGELRWIGLLGLIVQPPAASCTRGNTVPVLISGVVPYFGSILPWCLCKVYNSCNSQEVTGAGTVIW